MYSNEIIQYTNKNTSKTFKKQARVAGVAGAVGQRSKGSEGKHFGQQKLKWFLHRVLVMRAYFL